MSESAAWRDLGGNPPDLVEPFHEVRRADDRVVPVPPPWLELGLTWKQYAEQLREGRDA